MNKSIAEALKKLESLSPEEWQKLREKIEADDDKETQEMSKKVLAKYAAARKPQTPAK